MNPQTPLHPEEDAAQNQEFVASPLPPVVSNVVHPTIGQDVKSTSEMPPVSQAAMPASVPEYHGNKLRYIVAAAIIAVLCLILPDGLSSRLYLILFHAIYVVFLPGIAMVAFASIKKSSLSSAIGFAFLAPFFAVPAGLIFGLIIIDCGGDVTANYGLNQACSGNPLLFFNLVLMSIFLGNLFLLYLLPKHRHPQ